MLKAILKDEEGATAIEYGLIAALISVTIIAGATSLGTELGNTLTRIKDDISGATAQ
jgi:pilus assembly protein Flp/PilA